MQITQLEADRRGRTKVRQYRQKMGQAQKEMGRYRLYKNTSQKLRPVFLTTVQR